MLLLECFCVCSFTAEVLSVGRDAFGKPISVFCVSDGFPLRWRVSGNAAGCKLPHIDDINEASKLGPYLVMEFDDHLMGYSWIVDGVLIGGGTSTLIHGWHIDDHMMAA